MRVTEFATSLKQAEQGDYQAYLIGWSGRTDPDGNLYGFHACKAPNNYGGYCNAEVDKVLNEARTYSDAAKRKAVYEPIAKTLLSEGHIRYLYHRKVLIAHTTKVEGFKPVADGLVRVVGLRLK
jgi:peptide/nickel transport system substrate-binding protein